MNIDDKKTSTKQSVKMQYQQNRNILLLGKSGIGKSSVGNVLLGEKRFKTSMMEDRGTKSCQVEIKDNLTLVDTPGFFSSFRSDVDTANHIIDIVNQNRLPIYVFILVLSVDDRFTGDEEEILDLMMKVFGKEMVNNMMVIFTGKDSLEDDERQFKVPDCLPRHVPYFIVSCKRNYQADVKEILNEIFGSKFYQPLAIYSLGRQVTENIRRLENTRREESKIDAMAYKRAVQKGMCLEPETNDDEWSIYNICRWGYNYIIRLFR